MKKALALIMVAVFGTAVMFAQDVKKDTKQTPATTQPAKKEATKPAVKKNTKAVTPAKKEAAKPAEKPTTPEKK